MSAETFVMELTGMMEGLLIGPMGGDIMAGMGILLQLMGIMLACGALIKLIQMVCRWKIFTKAGEAGWKTLIPFYATYTEYRLTWAGKYGIMMMIFLAIANYSTFALSPENILYTIAALLGLFAVLMQLFQVHKLSVSFGHGVGFTLGLVFLKPIFLLILAFGKSEYVGPEKNPLAEN